MASFSAAVLPLRRWWTSVVSVCVLGRWARTWLVVITASFYRPSCTAFRHTDLSKEILAHRGYDGQACWEDYRWAVIRSLFVPLHLWETRPWPDFWYLHWERAM